MNVGAIGIFGKVLRGLRSEAPVSVAVRPLLAAAMVAFLLVGCASTYKEPTIPINSEVIGFIPRTSAWQCIPRDEKISKESALKRIMRISPQTSPRLPLTCIYEKLSKSDVDNLAKTGVMEARYLKVFQDYIPEEGGICKSKIRAQLKELSDQGFAHASTSAAGIAGFCKEWRLEYTFFKKALDQGAYYLTLVPRRTRPLSLPPPSP
ncbi:MAG: hypothetical protein H3C28_05815 [Sphingomonadales bacterium]|nr:hypothetical protein [Sphingomonadales bacterium]